MADITIRPTLKLIQLGYVLAGLAAVGIAAVTYYESETLYGLIAIVLFLWPVSKHVRRQLTKVTIQGDKLRYELGLLSKTTRTIQLSKVQDITVRQSLVQRLTGVGDLSIETAGETSRLTVINIDRPQAVADKVMELAQLKNV